MGYWIGPIDGGYGQLTEQAVVAFQKVNGLTRDGMVGPEVRAAMDEPRYPQARSTQGYWVEVDEVHGYENVPPYPASHGCVRVTIEAMNHLWETGALPIGHQGLGALTTRRRCLTQARSALGRACPRGWPGRSRWCRPARAACPAGTA